MTVTLFGWNALASCSVFPSKLLFIGSIPGGATLIVEQAFSTFVVEFPGDDWAQLVADRKWAFHKEAVAPASAASIILRAPQTC